MCTVVFNESICTGSPELVGMVMERRDQQTNQFRNRDIPKLLETLENSPDFYVEMKWEFASWGMYGGCGWWVWLVGVLVRDIDERCVISCSVPFVSRMCPNDTYRIWKKGRVYDLIVEHSL